MSATRFSAPSTSKTPSERIELGSEGRDALPQGFRFHARVLAHPTYDDENDRGQTAGSGRAARLQRAAAAGAHGRPGGAGEYRPSGIIGAAGVHHARLRRT